MFTFPPKSILDITWAMCRNYLKSSGLTARGVPPMCSLSAAEGGGEGGRISLVLSGQVLLGSVQGVPPVLPGEGAYAGGKETLAFHTVNSGFFSKMLVILYYNRCLLHKPQLKLLRM